MARFLDFNFKNKRYEKFNYTFSRPNTIIIKL